MRDLTAPETETLERLIDATSLGAILEALSDICDEKASHIRSYYFDEKLAKAWDTAGGRVGVMATHADITALEYKVRS